MAKDFTRRDLENTSYDWMPELASTMRAWSQEDEEIAKNLQTQARNPGGGEEWTGDGGQAAQDKAHDLGVPITSLADTRNAAADLIDQAHQPFVENRQKILDQVCEIEKPVTLIVANGDHFDLKQLARVTDNWGVEATPEAEATVAAAPAEDKDELVRKIQQMAQQDVEDLQGRLQEFKDADDSWTGRLTQAVRITAEDLQQLAQQSNPLLEETPEQARQDVQDYLEGHASEEEMARIQAAASLTPQQQRSFKDGTLQLPTQQALVLQQLSDQLKGKSDADITKMANSLPGGKAIANAEQLYSNPRVSSGLVPGADGKPEKWQGGIGKLATDTQRILSSPVARWKIEGPSNDGNVYASLEYPSKDGLASVTGRASLSDQGLRQGSFIDGAIATKGAELLHAQEHPESVPGWSADSRLVFQQSGPQHDQDPLVQNMLQYASTDHQSTHDLVAGTDGQHPNDQFLQDLTGHKFSDQGHAAGSLFAAMEANTDPTNPNVGPHQATISGETAHALAAYLADHKADLGDLGKNNPGLLQGAADLEKHYIPAMLGEQDRISRHPDGVAPTAGFKSLESYHYGQGSDGYQYARTRDLFAVLDQDPESKKTIHEAAAAHSKILQANYAASVQDGQPRAEYLHDSAALDGIANHAAYQEALGHYKDDEAGKAAAAQEAKRTVSAAWDTTKTLGGTVLKLFPYGGQVSTVIDILNAWAKDPIQSSLAGPASTPGLPPNAWSYDPIGVQVNMLEALQSHSGNLPGNTSALNQFINPQTGQLEPARIQGNPGALKDALSQYWRDNNQSQVNQDIGDAERTYGEVYN